MRHPNVINMSSKPNFTKSVQMTMKGYQIKHINRAKDPTNTPPQVGGGRVTPGRIGQAAPTWKKILRGTFNPPKY